MRRLFILFYLLANSLLGISPAVSALSPEQNNVLKSGIYYFNTDDSVNCTVYISSKLNGNDNMERAFNYFLGKGLTANQSAGIVGNMVWESGGLEPQKVQGDGNSKNPVDAGSQGWGIVQWTPANTKVPGIIKDARITGPVYELSTQLDMVWAQLTGRAGGYSETNAGKDIKSTTTLEEAVRAFQGDMNTGGKYAGFERPADEASTLPDRTDLAKQVLQKYGGGSGTVSVPSDSNGNCSASGPGQNTQFVDGFTVYSQCDPDWKDKPYGSGGTQGGCAGPNTIGTDGCGPSAMAMIITALTGKQVTPDVAAAYATSQKLYVPGAGSSWSIAPVLAKHWGLKATPIGNSIAKISATLQAGGLVIASGSGALPFTESGHYIVIRAAMEDGKWKVGDSGHDNTSSQSWAPQQLIKSMNDGSVYAISK
jgi:hypothetical protein